MKPNTTVFVALVASLFAALVAGCCIRYTYFRRGRYVLHEPTRAGFERVKRGRRKYYVLGARLPYVSKKKKTLDEEAAATAAAELDDISVTASRGGSSGGAGGGGGGGAPFAPHENIKNKQQRQRNSYSAPFAARQHQLGTSPPRRRPSSIGSGSGSGSGCGNGRPRSKKVRTDKNKNKNKNKNGSSASSASVVDARRPMPHIAVARARGPRPVASVRDGEADGGEAGGGAPCAHGALPAEDNDGVSVPGDGVAAEAAAVVVEAAAAAAAADAQGSGAGADNGEGNAAASTMVDTAGIATAPATAVDSVTVHGPRVAAGASAGANGGAREKNGKKKDGGRKDGVNAEASKEKPNGNGNNGNNGNDKGKGDANTTSTTNVNPPANNAIIPSPIVSANAAPIAGSTEGFPGLGSAFGSDFGGGSAHGAAAAANASGDAQNGGAAAISVTSDSEIGVPAGNIPGMTFVGSGGGAR